MTRRALPVIAALCVLVFTACNGDDDSADTSPPLPTAPPTDVTAEPTTTRPPTTTTTSTTDSNPVPTPPPASSTAPATITPTPSTRPGGGTMPEIPQLVPDVPTSLLTPEQLDPTNTNNSRPILPEHEPVIEAYLRAIEAINHVASQDPINTQDPELLGAPLTAEILAQEQAGLRRFADTGARLNVEQGVTHRPYILEPVDPAGTALFDCELAGHYWVDAAGSRLDEPVWPAGPGQVVEVGLVVEMVQQDGQWLWSRSFLSENACA